LSLGFRQGTASAVPKIVDRGAALAAEGMSVLSRHHSLPGTYFITSRTWESRKLFSSAPYCESFIETLFHYRKEGAYALHAYVLMPDHFHVMVTPAFDKTIELVGQLIKGDSARRLGVEQHMRFPVWQSGFSDHRIRDFADIESHIKYNAENPVSKKLVSEATEFAWSSRSITTQLDAPPQGLKPQQREASLRHG
jgi:putative transposase